MEFKLAGTKNCLLPLIDIYTREVLSYSYRTSPNVKLVMEMMGKGFPNNPYNNLLIHTDQEIQYQNIGFIED